MSENSHIEWTDHTANFWWGCFKVSDGCKNCYAETLVKRFGDDNIWGPPKTTDRELKTGIWNALPQWNRKAKKEGKRRKVFVQSMSDFFEDHPQVTEWRNNALSLMVDCRWLDFQILTKRPENVRRMTPPGWWLSDARFPDNFWIGTSVENQEMADRRIPHLLEIPVAIRFLSMEPMLGPIDLTDVAATSEGSIDALNPTTWENIWNLWNEYGDEESEDDFNEWFNVEDGSEMSGLIHPGIQWIIVGGESGPKKRPFNPDWARSIRDQCQAAGVPFFMKQIDKIQPIPADLMIREFPTDPADCPDCGGEVWQCEKCFAADGKVWE